MCVAVQLCCAAAAPPLPPPSTFSHFLDRQGFSSPIIFILEGGLYCGRAFFIVVVVAFASSSFSRCVGSASFTRPCRFQNYWHGGETGWQRLSGCGYRGAKCALACEAEGRVVVPGAGGGGWCHGGTGRRRRRRNTEGRGGNGGEGGGAWKPGSLGAAAVIGRCGPQVIFGAHIKRTGCECENTVHFQSFASYLPCT